MALISLNQEIKLTFFIILTTFYIVKCVKLLAPNTRGFIDRGDFTVE